ncbi:MAG: FAD-dependent oxidoreductase, partial [Chromatiales bacterium]|nr:FAD-dependent oxidoreductase [Chromatiales bacterium]
MKVIVIGAGIAGLATATWLAERGLTVQVLEAGDRVGGRAVTVRRPDTGDILDGGSQYFHSNYRRALGLIRGVALDGDLNRIGGHTRFFDGSVEGDSYLLNHRLPWVKPAGLLGNGRLGLFLLDAVRRLPGDPYALGRHTGADAIDAMAYAHPLVRRHVLRPLMAAGALALPQSARPSVLHMARLVRIVLLTDYLCLAQGNAALHERLAARLPVKLMSPVSSLVVEQSTVTGVVLAGSGTVLGADHVVVATTA